MTLPSIRDQGLRIPLSPNPGSLEVLYYFLPLSQAIKRTSFLQKLYLAEYQSSASEGTQNLDNVLLYSQASRAVNHHRLQLAVVSMSDQDQSLADPSRSLMSSKRTRPTTKQFQRAYQACTPCRKRKAKCDLGVDSSTPCARCRREHRQCVFSAQRGSAKRQKTDNGDRSSSIQQEDQVQNPSQAINDLGRVFVSYGSDSILSAHPSSQVETPQPMLKTKLSDPVISTILSSGKDALNILFEAAAHQEELAATAKVSNYSPLGTHQSHNTPGSLFSSGTTSAVSNAVNSSHPSPDILKTWSYCRFVIAGWLSAEDAITYIDLFFENMCPLSPVVTNYYQNQERHFELLTQEPLLTCTILMISSRYHLLPCLGAASRGFFIHERLWHYCQHLIQRILYGQEKSSNVKTRTLGSIEALLLICEWHSRSLHFPPSADGWDARIYMGADESHNKVSGMQPTSSNSTRWLEDVIEPARRSDRMSWMLLGTALTLAHELGVFDEDDEEVHHRRSPKGSQQETNSFETRKHRLRKLLYVYINQLALRLGCTTTFPKDSNLVKMVASATSDEWQAHMSSWIELTKLVKSASEFFFPSPSVTRQLLNTGRYRTLLDHFVPLLEQWQGIHLESKNYHGPYQDTLFIEYHYARIYINSIGMEAVCQRAVSEIDTRFEGAPLRTMLDNQEHGFINEVVDGGIQILERTIKLAETDRLRFSPVRTFLRITTSSVFLLKAISLGIRNAKLQTALDTLGRSIQAIRLSNLDEMHVAARYAVLLETHVARLRQKFMVSSQKYYRHNHVALRRDSPLLPTSKQANGMTPNQEASPTDAMRSSVNGRDPHLMQELSADDWLSLPFDPSMAPFGADGAFGFPALDENALDFIWNLPAG